MQIFHQVKTSCQDFKEENVDIKSIASLTLFKQPFGSH